MRWSGRQASASGSRNVTRIELEARLQRLVGRTLTGVCYFEIDYGTPNPTWSDDWGVDSLDFGLQLILDDGSRCNLSWGGEFAQYGISLEAPVAESARRIRSAEVSESSRWHTLLGRRIGAVRVYWCLAEEVDSPGREYPQDATFFGFSAATSRA